MENRAYKSEEPNVRKGPWPMEEDLILINYISHHGEGVWNSLAKSAGLKRNGKSCRLRWLNYLRPDVRRGNITPDEQLVIMELHSKWGNRWSKIAKHLPGRTDNEIKNYWRTKIQKHVSKRQPDTLPRQIFTLKMQPAASSHAVCADEDKLETYSPPVSFERNVDIMRGSLPTESTTDGYWSMEDMWSLHLLGCDQVN